MREQRCQERNTEILRVEETCIRFQLMRVAQPVLILHPLTSRRWINSQMSLGGLQIFHTIERRFSSIGRWKRRACSCWLWPLASISVVLELGAFKKLKGASAASEVRLKVRRICDRAFKDPVLCFSNSRGFHPNRQPLLMLAAR